MDAMFCSPSLPRCPGAGPQCRPIRVRGLLVSRLRGEWGSLERREKQTRAVHQAAERRLLPQALEPSAAVPAEGLQGAALPGTPPAGSDLPPSLPRQWAPGPSHGGQRCQSSPLHTRSRALRTPQPWPPAFPHTLGSDATPTPIYLAGHPRGMAPPHPTPPHTHWAALPL
ncbi:hypothetical protein NDU88_008619 [Pleurodeles waltl]|uniref:Uncharacterized protein n=1 Tax=Pleurodeles waltl TaxID=8319 RepID=A0AAV7NDL7_PLEWA|nr:hypothetical protein NDU88_008619 [Pleurodeles waltl]